MRSTPAARAAGSGPDEHAVAPMNTAMGRMPLRLLCMVFPFRFFRVSTEAIPVTTGAQVRRSVASRLREAKSFAEGMAGEGSATKERRGPAGPRVTNRAGPSGLAPDDWCLKNTSHLGTEPRRTVEPVGNGAPMLGIQLRLDSAVTPATRKPMFHLHFWPTPNGKKITIFLEEAGL